MTLSISGSGCDMIDELKYIDKGFFREKFIDFVKSHGMDVVGGYCTYMSPAGEFVTLTSYGLKKEGLPIASSEVSLSVGSAVEKYFYELNKYITSTRGGRVYVRLYPEIVKDGGIFYVWSRICVGKKIPMIFLSAYQKLTRNKKIIRM